MSSAPKVIVVVPTVRPQQYASFLEAWRPLFRKHHATLVTVFDGDVLQVQIDHPGNGGSEIHARAVEHFAPKDLDLFYRRSDVCRNIGFVAAAHLIGRGDGVVVTLDDDVAPLSFGDPIQEHLTALSKRVSITWMNTAHHGAEYLRGFPYSVREESPVMVSHGVWTEVPDFDGETQLRLEGTKEGVPYCLPYYVGPVPQGVWFPVCGMNLAFRKEMLPHVYFAPMGPDTGIDGLHRFGDIWCGTVIQVRLWSRRWALYTGASTVRHTRASDAKRNVEQEAIGRRWNEGYPGLGHYPRDMSDPHERDGFKKYCHMYANRRDRYDALVSSVLTGVA